MVPLAPLLAAGVLVAFFVAMMVVGVRELVEQVVAAARR
jgi:hypothetical protein